MLNLRKYSNLTWRISAGLSAFAASLWVSPALADVAQAAPAAEPSHAVSEFVVIPVGFGIFLITIFILSKLIRGGDGVENTSERGFPIPFDDDHPHHH